MRKSFESLSRNRDPVCVGIDISRNADGKRDVVGSVFAFMQQGLKCAEGPKFLIQRPQLIFEFSPHPDAVCAQVGYRSNKRFADF